MDVGVGCMRYFGVRSYLDNFYDRRGNDHEQQGFASNKYSSSSRPRFSSRWWKILLWIGSIVVIAGLTLLLIGFLLPRKREQLEDSSSSDPEVIIVDRQALAYNAHLDTSHLVGVCLVLFGGVLFAASLLMPTFCHMWCANSDTHDETDPLRLRMEVSTNEQSIPVRSIPKSIQPSSRASESRLTTDGTVPIASSR